MKAISELPKRGAPISTAVGASWHSGRGPALENAIGRLQTWISKPVIRRMSDRSSERGLLHPDGRRGRCSHLAARQIGGVSRPIVQAPGGDAREAGEKRDACRRFSRAAQLWQDGSHVRGRRSHARTATRR